MFSPTTVCDLLPLEIYCPPPIGFKQFHNVHPTKVLLVGSCHCCDYRQPYWTLYMWQAAPLCANFHFQNLKGDECDSLPLQKQLQICFRTALRLISDIAPSLNPSFNGVSKVLRAFDTFNSLCTVVGHPNSYATEWKGYHFNGRTVRLRKGQRGQQNWSKWPLGVPHKAIEKAPQTKARGNWFVHY